MLSDQTQSEEFRKSEHWKSKLLDFKAIVTLPDGRQRSNSLSGGESNRLVMRSGDGFVDRSLVSGVDCREDARSFSLLDYDNDGWVDIALASVNDKRLRLFRNRFGDLGAKGRVVEVSLQGANGDARVSQGFSNRDAVGAVLTVVTSKSKRAYRKSIGEGMAALNLPGNSNVADYAFTGANGWSAFTSTTMAATQGNGNGAEAIHDVSGNSARYIGLEILTNNGNYTPHQTNPTATGRVGLAEFAVTQGAAVPEPSSTALLGLGALALILRRRK